MYLSKSFIRFVIDFLIYKIFIVFNFCKVYNKFVYLIYLYFKMIFFFFIFEFDCVFLYILVDLDFGN